MDNIDAQITESVVFSILGHKKVGPQLFGVFPGGRLEEYIKVGIVPYCLKIKWTKIRFNINL